ncbi:MAG: hypothetical protein DWQ02_28610, partial [Bacteroidetes bacterium]
CIQLFNKEGKIIDDADLKIGRKKLRFNSKRQAYVDKKSNRQGLLTVTRNGKMSFYNVAREYDNSALKRLTRKASYGLIPLRYAWRPVKFVIHLPVDGVKSIKNGWPRGTIGKSVHFFERSFERVICMFIKSPSCERNREERKFRKEHKGYMVFNKPKYLPGDTVKVKAYLVNNKGKPVDEQVTAVLRGTYGEFHIGDIDPYQKGGYEFEFTLHDTMKLKLDRAYHVKLQTKRRRAYISGRMDYEDYELSKVNLTLRKKNKKHFRGQDMKFYAKGTDENELNLLDARLEILVTPQTVLRFFDSEGFIPDSLYFHKQKLEPRGETEIILPDSIFPNGNINYHVKVKLLTPDNETIEASENFQFFKQMEKIEYELIADSIRFSYQKNGLISERKMEIFGVDDFGNKTLVYSGSIPCTLPLNAYFDSYFLKSPDFSGRVSLYGESPLLRCYSEHKEGTINILVDNPRKIPFSYHIYKKNKLVDSGYGKTLNFSKKTLSKKNYFISLRYIWAGYRKEEDYRIPLLDKQLNIDVEEPNIVFPGQRTEVEMIVTDQRGKPVKGVDLTAYGLTSKFDHTPPTVPYFGKTRKNKTVINNFGIGKAYVNIEKEPLEYDSWKAYAGLDTIEYYKFLYPEGGIYRYEFTPEDSITQFSPFVVDNGALQPVHVIYVDAKPIYFSWSTHTQPYSFKVSAGYHRVWLRTSHQFISIDSLYVPEGKKLVFSIDVNKYQKFVRVTKMEPALSDREKSFYYKQIFSYQYHFGARPAYIEQGDMIQFLKPQPIRGRYPSTYLAGPLSGIATFHLVDDFSMDFTHEPFYKYKFSSNMLKLKCVDEELYPDSLWIYPLKTTFTDLVVTKESIEKKWYDHLNTLKYSAMGQGNPQFTNEGAGRLQLRVRRGEGFNKPASCALVFKHEDPEFLRIYSGRINQFQDLAQGYYKIIYLFRDGNYLTCDSLFIRPNGMNYYSDFEPEVMEKDSFSAKILNAIEGFQWEGNSYYFKKEVSKEIKDAKKDAFKFSGIGKVVEGYVYDEATGEPLTGASILVKGTSYGTVTDIEGHYKIKVPLDRDQLLFSYLGYFQEEVNLGDGSVVNMELIENTVQAQEVLISAVGLQSSGMLMESVVIADNIRSVRNPMPQIDSKLINALSGKVAGVVISPSTGQPGGGVNITIRGSQAVSFDKEPLYVIDGAVFMGDIATLDQGMIEKMEVIKDSEEAIALYGVKAVNGVVIIETKDGVFGRTKALGDKGADYDEAFLEAASQANSIRKNFSDYAFWQPQLITDRKGRAKFSVTFPDDVTSWSTHYLAMNGKKQSGQTSGLIKSYKPLMARLAMPRFLVEGDTTNAMGKILNYMPDSANVATHLEINDQQQQTGMRVVGDALIDTLTITGISDTMTVKYYLEKEDGYLDGEEREIPVFPKGLVRTEGRFHTLDRDTTLYLKFASNYGKVILTARSSQLSVLEDEIRYLAEYKYLCNEQLASKLKAILAWKIIQKYEGSEFEGEEDIRKIIKQLAKRQNPKGLWGWWLGSKESIWISMHVIEALAQAEKLGYDIEINKIPLGDQLLWKLKTDQNFINRVRYLKLLNLLEVAFDAKPFLEELEEAKPSGLHGLLQLNHVKQLYEQEYDLDTLNTFKETTYLGNIFFDAESNTRWYNFRQNDLQNTLLAYKILRADTNDHENTLSKIRHYFFEKRFTGHWGNTYESAKIIETIFPDLLKADGVTSPPELVITGQEKMVIDSFPYTMTIDSGQEIKVEKSGGYDVYLSSEQRYWEIQPPSRTEEFEIISRFDADSLGVLMAGAPVKLIVNLEAKKDAEYLMINIPIPAGCSYGEKKRNNWQEAHREYYKNETAIFISRLQKGNYQFEIELIPRFTGVYTLNPAKVEWMYFPFINGNNELKTVRIDR